MCINYLQYSQNIHIGNIKYKVDLKKMINTTKIKTILRVYAMCAISLCLSLTIVSLPTCATDEIYSNAVRLHIIATSDNDEDQRIKYIVRDQILLELGDVLSTMPSELASYKYLQSNKDLVEKIANNTLEEHGYNYSAKVDIGIHTYPTRMYKSATLPAGQYRSVRVILGEGKGKNWWCVIYPPMCLNIEEDDTIIDTPLSYEEEIIFKSIILDAFGKDTPQPSKKAKSRLLRWIEKLGG